MKALVLFILLGLNCITLTEKFSTVDTNSKRFLALGDSYTIGESIAEKDRFAAQTIAHLRVDGIKIKDADYIAKTGWTTTDLKTAIEKQKLQPPYDIVSLLIGVNDQYQTHDTINYRNDFKQLLLKAIALADNKPSHVFVLSIPDYSVTPFVDVTEKAQVKKEIDWFNSINQQVAFQYHVVYIDITTSTREAATNAALIAGDGLHPSAKEYKKWAEKLYVKIKEVLK